MDNKNTHPPRLLLLFFRWFCHPDYREEIEGDLTERFHQRAQQYRPWQNSLLFMKDIFSLFRPQIIGKVYRFTVFPFSFARLIYHNLRITAVVVAPLWIIAVIVLTLTNSKGCKQFIIDSSEVRIHADIPKVDFCGCFYDTKRDVRLAMYTLKVDAHDYIQRNDLKEVDRKDARFITSVSYKNQPRSEKLYARSGVTWGDTWQYIVEKESGRIWIEISFGTTPITTLIDIITHIIFYIPQTLLVLYLFKRARMTYLNLRKLKISPF